MAPLPNLRHEKFARAYIKEPVAARAYLKAGYKASTRNSLDVSACQLLRRPKVQSRIKELRRQMAARNRITVDSLLADLAEDRALARQLGQASAAIQATQLAAKLVGLLVDRKEQGAPGEFAGLKSPEEIVDAIRAELGDKAAELLQASLGSEPEPDLAQVERGEGDQLN